MKRLAARASLQATEIGQILTPVQLFNWAQSNILGVKFFFVSSEEVQVCSSDLQERFESIKTISGTRSHHRFVPLSSATLNMYRLSCDDLHTTVAISSVTDFTANELNITIGQYVAAVYDGQWYIGTITEKSAEHGDVLVNFMSRNSRTNTLCWPARTDECAVVFQNLLCIVPVPDAIGSTGRQYKLPSHVIDEITEKFKCYLARQDMH